MAGTLKGGVYALFLRVPDRLVVRIGALGDREFATGVYIYVGSARNSLPGRISRHLRQTKKKHWHIDYLLGGTIVQPIGVAWKLTRQRIECSISRKIASSASTSVDGFGCSDCDCESHLHSFPLFQQAAEAIPNLGFCYLGLQALYLDCWLSRDSFDGLWSVASNNVLGGWDL